MIFIAFISSFVTIYLGTFVRISGAGLGCPDWPLCHGSIVPPPDIYAWIEWSHRTSVALTGILVIIVAIIEIRRFKLLAVVPLPLFLGQVLLGAMTVITELHPLVASLHTVFAAGIIGTLGFLWGRALKPSINLIDQKYSRMLLMAIVFSFMVLITGTFVTRSGSSAVCTLLPICFSSHGSIEANKLHIIQMIHRLFGFSVAIILLVMVLKSRGVDGFFPVVTLILILGLSQILLGVLNVALRLPPETRILHVAIGNMFLASLCILLGYTRALETRTS